MSEAQESAGKQADSENQMYILNMLENMSL